MDWKYLLRNIILEHLAQLNQEWNQGSKPLTNQNIESALTAKNRIRLSPQLASQAYHRAIKGNWKLNFKN